MHVSRTVNNQSVDLRLTCRPTQKVDEKATLVFGYFCIYFFGCCDICQVTRYVLDDIIYKHDSETHQLAVNMHDCVCNRTVAYIGQNIAAYLIGIGRE